MGLKLNIFNVKNRPSGGRILNAEPCINFSDTGNVSFSKAVVVQFQLKATHKIAFAQDRADTKKWFWFFDIDNGLDLRAKGQSGLLQCSHAELTRLIRKTYPTEGKSTTFVVGEAIDDEGLTIFPLEVKQK